MNRYKTAPGLGPSKASATTTCQKCLQRGHYSYECKSALQSRPYVSRASRTQQLRNPRLKPALSETKLEENNKQPDPPKGDSGGGVDDHEVPTGGDDNDRPVKRQRRSPSVSSVDSVLTISTNASDTKPAEKRAQSREASVTRPESNNQRSRLPAKGRRSPDTRSKSPSARRRDRSPYSSRRNETSPDRKRNPNQDNSGPRGRRERSLSPYSRRLALTQAMNLP